MKKILIVVDIQNGFVRYEQTKNVAKKIIDLVNKNIFDEVIATRFINREGSQYTKFIGWHRLINEPDICLIDELKPNYVVDKNVYTCVNDNFLAFLKEINDGEIPKHIFIVGVDTDCCVLKTSIDLFEHFIMPIVLTNYCDSNGGPESHFAALKVMERTIGTKCIVSGDVDKYDIEEIVKEREY